MKKRILCVVLAMCLGLSMAACSEAPDKSSLSQSEVSEPIISAPVESMAVSEGLSEQECIDLLTPILHELGEDNSIQIVALDEPEALIAPSTTSGDEEKSQNVHFTVGDRNLQALFYFSQDEVEVFSISEEDEPSKYYYNTGIEALHELGTSITLGNLYDYHTGEEIDLDAVAESAVESAIDDVDDILSNLPAVSVNLDSTEDTTLSLDVALTDDDPDAAATHFYYYALQFLAEYLDLECFPYSLLTFNPVVNGETIGTMLCFTSPETGALGADKPIIYNDVYSDAFSAKYEEYMTAFDFEALSEKSE